MRPTDALGQTADPARSDPSPRVPLTPGEFTDRVMAVLATAPHPTPTRSFLAALREGTPRNAARALSVASHLVTVRTWPVAPRVRARSLALVLGVAFVLATGSLVAAAAVREVVPLRLGGPDAIVVGGSGVGSPSPARRPAAPTPAPPVAASAEPLIVRTPGDDVATPSGSTGATHGADDGRATDGDHGGSAADGGPGAPTDIEEESDDGDHAEDASDGSSGDGSDGAEDDHDPTPAPTETTDGGDDQPDTDAGSHLDDDTNPDGGSDSGG